MIDTSSVNFAIDKLSAGWAKVAPTIQDVGEKYVQYVVTVQIIQFAIAGACFLAAIAFAVWVARFIRPRWEKACKYGDEAGYVVLGIAAGLAVMGTFATLCGNGYYATLAYTNPEMFAIHEILRAAK